jgi:hypothetical protein
VAKMDATGKVNGVHQDMQARKATPKPAPTPKVVLCKRCERVGATKDCKGCEAASEAAKVATNGKKSHDGNGAAPKPGKPVFDDRPFPKLFGQLVRFIDNRKRAMGAGPAGEGHAECRDALGAVLAAWKRWQRVTT